MSSNFCEFCGAKLKGAASGNKIADTDAERKSVTTKNTANLSTLGNKWGYLIIIAILAIIAAIAYFFLSTGSVATNLLPAPNSTILLQSGYYYAYNFTVPAYYRVYVYGGFSANVTTSVAIGPVSEMSDYVNGITNNVSKFVVVNSTVTNFNVTEPAGSYTIALWGGKNFSADLINFTRGINISSA
jgi:hypothetical protein